MTSRWSAVFLDRDGTINVKAPEGQYVTTVHDLVLLPGAGEAVARLTAEGLPVFVVTNQRGVARGVMGIDDLDGVNARLVELLEREGGRISGVASCVHAGGDCECRKPLPGLLHQTADLNPTVDLTTSVMIGDAPSDMAAGRSAGCVTVRLGTDPYGEADKAVPSLLDAVDWLFSDEALRLLKEREHRPRPQRPGVPPSDRRPHHAPPPSS